LILKIGVRLSKLSEIIFVKTYLDFLIEEGRNGYLAVHGRRLKRGGV
jgi:hypothetical protein